MRAPSNFGQWRLQMGSHRFERIGAIEWHYPRKRFIEQYPRGVDVGTRSDVIRAVQDLFGRHISRRAKARIVAQTRRRIEHRGQAGEPEIGEFDPEFAVHKRE